MGKLIAVGYDFTTGVNRPVGTGDFLVDNLGNAISGTGLNITTTSLPNAMMGQSYSQTITNVGGVVPIAWSIPAGALPPGLSLNSTTGVISGTATASGTFNFTVRATDAYGSVDDQPLSIVSESANFGLTFDGIDDVLKSISTLAIGANWTVQFHCKLVVNPTTERALGGLSGMDFRLKTTNKVGIFGILESVTALSTTSWNHVAITGQPGTLTTDYKIIMNGLLEAASTNITSRPTTSAFSIGDNTSGGMYANIIVDDVRVYNITRTPAEIASDKNMQLSAPFPSGLIFCAKLNDNIAFSLSPQTIAEEVASNAQVYGFAGAGNQFVTGAF